MPMNDTRAIAVNATRENLRGMVMTQTECLGVCNAFRLACLDGNDYVPIRFTMEPAEHYDFVKAHINLSGDDYPRENPCAEGVIRINLLEGKVWAAVMLKDMEEDHFRRMFENAVRKIQGGENYIFEPAAKAAEEVPSP